MSLGVSYIHSKCIKIIALRKQLLYALNLRNLTNFSIAEDQKMFNINSIHKISEMWLNCNSTHKDGNKIYQIFTTEKDIL